jgi:hypothetical protein
MKNMEDKSPKLTRVTRLDAIPAEKAVWTDEGYLKDKPVVTSVGIFEYRNEDGGIRRELRLPEHVFDPESLASYKGKPVIITHRARIVTNENVPDEIIGTILSDGIPDGSDVRAEVIIHDTDAMKRSGLKELSLGYNLVLDETPGEWNGKPYDAVQTEIRINHLALVDKARAGEEARLNIDAEDGNEKTPILEGGKQVMAKAVKKQAMSADELKKSVDEYEKRRKARLDGEDEPSTIPEKIVIEGIVKPQGSAADDDTNPVASDNGGGQEEMTFAEKVREVRDRRDRRDEGGDPEDIEGAKGVIAQQDEDISTLLELIEKLQAAKDASAVPPKMDAAADDPAKDDDGEKPLNTDSVDAIVTERLKLARIGDRLNLDGIETLGPLDAKKRIIGAIKPEMRLDGKSMAYVDTAFEIVVAEHNSRKDTDYQRKQMFNSDGGDKRSAAGASGADKARERMKEKILYGGDE